MTLFQLDGTKMTTRDDAHAHIAAVLKFPAYYGKNLDALADCLYEIPKDSCIVFIDWKVMKKALGDYGERIISVFEDTAENRGISFVLCTDD